MFLQNAGIHLQDYTVHNAITSAKPLNLYIILGDIFTYFEGKRLNICTLCFPCSGGGWTQLHVGGQAHYYKKLGTSHKHLCIPKIKGEFRRNATRGNHLLVESNKVACRIFTNTSAFWDLTPCIPLYVNEHFGGVYHLHLEGGKSQARIQH